MRKITLTLMGLSALGVIAVTSTAASAMPKSSPDISSSNAEQVGYVCNEWGRCWWRPDYYRPRYRDDDDGARYYRRLHGYYGGYGYWGGYRGWHHRWHEDD